VNYFNYFTEIEEHFQRTRGSGLFLLSPLDWALIEMWKNSGIPLEAVLRGIDAAFDKWHARKKKTQAVNSLAYCAQAVLAEAEAMAKAELGGSSPAAEDANPFQPEAVSRHLSAVLEKLRALDGYQEPADSVERILADLNAHLRRSEELEQRLSAIEDKIAALAKTRLSDEALFEIRRELDNQLRPYRGKMSADQLAMLELKYLNRKVFETLRLPRLSLFYLHE
jgi:hypothetical protein